MSTAREFTYHERMLASLAHVVEELRRINETLSAILARLRREEH